MKRTYPSLIPPLIDTPQGSLPVLERRVAVRHRTDVSCEVRAFESPNWAQVKLANLSRTGARFQGVLMTMPGALVVIRVTLEDLAKCYELFGVVVWRKKGAFGIQFI